MMFVLSTGKWLEKGTLEAKDSALKANFSERTCANLTPGIRRGCIAWFVFFPLKRATHYVTPGYVAGAIC